MKSTAFLQDLSRTSKVQVIPYARFGRILKFNRTLFLIQLLVLTIFFEIIVVLLLDRYFGILTEIARNLFEKGQVFEASLFFLKIKYFVISGRLPTTFESLTCLAISIIILVLLVSRFNPLPENLTLWFVLVDIVYLTSSFYFVFFGENFPYTATDFGKIYFIQQVGIFLFTPIFLNLVLSIYAFNLVSLLLSFLAVVFTLFYASVFGAVRYFTFLLILHKWSFLHMPAMLVIGGSLLDIIYVVSFYSLCVYLIARFLQKKNYYQWGF